MTVKQNQRPRLSDPQPSTLDLQPAQLNLQPRINESVLGTGFWFLGEEVHSPVDIRKDETDRIDNRLDVLSKTFLGLTVACARCHDHKFDAISQRDYYALAGFALSGSYRQVRVDTEAQHREIAERLEELRANQRTIVLGSLVSAAKPTLDKLDQYLLAGKQALKDGASFEVGEDKQKRLAADSREKLNGLAGTKQLDAELLARWTVELEAARADKQHPLHGFAELTSPTRERGLPVDTNGQPSLARRASVEPMEGLVVDFVSLREDRLLQDGVVAQHLRAWIAYTPEAHDLFCWRTRSGVEVDFVVYGSTHFVAVEVKNSDRVLSGLRPGDGGVPGIGAG